jgi:hypothetical protein
MSVVANSIEAEADLITPCVPEPPDTIDLQDHDSPSAQDHAGQISQPGSLGSSTTAPHQAAAMKAAVQETIEEGQRSPRVSVDWQDGQQDNPMNPNRPLQDHQALQQNGSLAVSEDADMADAEGDDILDDDMMDKISSSPSIDDGLLLPSSLAISPWPLRSSSLAQTSVESSPRTPCVSPMDEDFSSSPYVQTPEYLPFGAASSAALQGRENISPDYHLHGEYRSQGRLLFGPAYGTSSDDPSSESPENTVKEDRRSLNVHKRARRLEEIKVKSRNGTHFLDSTVEEEKDDEVNAANRASPNGVAGTNEQQISRDSADNLLETSFDTYVSSTLPHAESWKSYYPEDDDYVEEDPLYADPRFVDSGWGSECLQDPEDIDFEFVYALHTFVATVDGQANATKGDTMVLLDDSNSYWWLVRVVKDASIGLLPLCAFMTPELTLFHKRLLTRRTYRDTHRTTSSTQ